ncbi:hypothetical protein RR46_00106 [Papilio xuthus]|uniref:Uncharacterized protein n=1 Tax=Papilio xuthus TaxID=66420 RepID=A0A0N0PA71_PAPXU|nr:hypothetical protein RR46_00106 [Papilio xuthus]
MGTIRTPTPAPSCISEDEDDSLNTTQRSDANSLQSLQTSRGPRDALCIFCDPRDAVVM